MTSLCYMLHDSHLGEDAVQEALILAWRDLRTLRDPDRFTAWMHRILVRSVYRADRVVARWPGHPLAAEDLDRRLYLVSERDRLRGTSGDHRRRERFLAAA